jgi:hypothetical protein
MNRIIVTGLVALAWVAGRAPTAGATGFPAAPPNPVWSRIQRVAQADIIVVAKVVKHEDKTEKAKLFPKAAEDAEWAFARLKVSKVLLGPTDLTEIRVGTPLKERFGNQKPKGPNQLPPKVRDTPKKALSFDLPLGRYNLFYVTKHWQGNFYQLSGILVYPPLKTKAQVDGEAAKVKRLANLLADPIKGLKSRNKDDRLHTAALRILKLRSGPPPDPQARPRTEPIDAEESKLIMSALAEADWFPAPGAQKVDPNLLFMSLNPSKEDGWVPPVKTAKDIGPSFSVTKAYARKHTLAARAWVQKHRATYRIQRFVKENEGK